MISPTQVHSRSHSAGQTGHPLKLQCPCCRGSLGELRTPEAKRGYPLFCSACDFELWCLSGIWKALPSEREMYFERFISEYQAVRSAEGRGSNNSTYYLELPYHDATGRNSAQWAIRSRSFSYLERRILPAIEAQHSGGLDVLDLGAGNCWLSYRLALRGHRAVAVDLLTNQEDGLGAATHFRGQLPIMFPRFQAELDHLPFPDAQFDVAIFNASFHYSENYEVTLAETVRCLRSGGVVIISDSPWYSNDASGQEMLAERRASFVARYGFASDSLASLEYLTDEKLRVLEHRCGVSWQRHSPYYGLRWTMRPWSAKLRHRREPSRFRIYVAAVRK